MSYPWPEGVRETVVVEALYRGALSFRQMEREIGVDHSTIHRWVHSMTAHSESRVPGSIRGTSLDLSVLDKLRVLLESRDLSEKALGVYLRRNGLYALDLEVWREELQLHKMGDQTMSRPKDKKKETIGVLRREKRELEKQLRRAIKLRREAEVLVEVQKKAQRIWAQDAKEDEK